MRHHPTLCGLFQFFKLRKLHRVGTDTVHVWKCLLGVVHPYSAMRQTGHMAVEWEDLEFIIKSYGSSHPFLGEPPSTLKDCETRLLLAKGFPVSAMASNTREGQLSTHSGGYYVGSRACAKSRRDFVAKQPLLDIMRERYCFHNGQRKSALVVRDVETAISKLDGDQLSGEQSDLVKQWKKNRRLSPVNLLKTIRHGIQAEESQMCFDLLTLNRRCLELLRKLKQALD